MMETEKSKHRPRSDFRIRSSEDDDDQQSATSSQREFSSRAFSSRAFSSRAFSSRAVKLRLFAMVCGVMLVLVLMFEARNPQNWRWMGFGPSERPIDTRYLANIYPQQPSSNNAGRPKVESKSDSKTGQQINLQEANSGDQKTKSDQPANQQEVDHPEFQIAEKDFWDSNYRQLNFRQRMLLLEGFYLTRNEKKLDEHQASEWMRIVEQFSVANDRYQADILKYVTTLSENDSERGKLTRTLFHLQTRWKQFEPVLKKIGDRDSLNSDDKTATRQLQEVLDQTMLGFVEDNSLQSFVNDQPAMFRLIEKMQTDQLWDDTNQPEKVLFSQLYKETDRLRGKPVTFKGLIRGAYAAKPAANYLGLEKFFVYWIQIDGAQNPVAVYSLEQPKDFVADLNDYSAKAPAEMREKVDVKGILFQKMVYAAEDGQRIAPVIFTDVPAWKPSIKEDLSERELPGLTSMVAIFLAIGGTLAFFTWGFVSWNNRKHGKRIAELKKRIEGSDDESKTTVRNDKEDDFEN